jgi:hypothetical protein
MPRQQEAPAGRATNLEKTIKFVKTKCYHHSGVIYTNESGARKSGERPKPAEKEKDVRFFEP